MRSWGSTSTKERGSIVEEGLLCMRRGDAVYS